MLKDAVRTGSYRRAIGSNPKLRDKSLFFVFLQIFFFFLFFFSCLLSFSLEFVWCCSCFRRWLWYRHFVYVCRAIRCQTCLRRTLFALILCCVVVAIDNICFDSHTKHSLIISFDCSSWNRLIAPILSLKLEKSLTPTDSATVKKKNLERILCCHFF